MKILKNYNSFINENINSDDKDINIILNYVYDHVSTSEISSMKKLFNTYQFESLNENVFTELKNKLVKWFDDKMMLYFINKKKSFYTDLVGKLDLFDLTTLDNVVKNYPKFRKCDSIYLAGGMDKAKDEGAGWRNVTEYLFEIENPGTKKSNDEITLKYKGEVYNLVPSYVVDGINLETAIAEGKSFLKKNYNAPAIFNPVRKEVDRTKNTEFADKMKSFKSGKYSNTTDSRDFDTISDVFSKTIEPDDEKLLLLADALLYGANESDSAGTFGELQTLSFLNKPLFVWYQKDWKIEGHSPWTVPHITKIIRTQEEMSVFAETLVKFGK